MRETLILVAFLSVAWGCESDSKRVVNGCDDCPVPYPLATTQDTMVENFVRTFNEMNYEEYEKMLHEDFVFYFSPDEIDVIGQGEAWFRPEDLESTRNMFNGGTGRKPDGTIQAPIQQIILELTPESATDTWTDQVPEDFLGTTMRRYEVDMDVTYTDGGVDEVTGVQEFYAAAVETETTEGTVTTYQLKFWRDLGKDVAKATRQDSFSSVKAAF